MTEPDSAGPLSAARKRELLAQRLRARAKAPVPYPLSFGQQRLWFLDKFSSGSAAYNLPMGMRLRGGLDRAALRAALDTVVGRHAALRTTFPESGGEPVQLVAPTGTAELREHALTGPDRDAAAQRFADERGAEPFDLHSGPLLRVDLGRFDQDDHVLVLNLHHIISDAWSLSVLLDELGVCYRAAVSGTLPELPELPLQYPDFAAWQRDRVGDGAEHLDYWAEHLSGAPELLTLPTDRPRPAVASYRGALHQQVVPGAVVDRLEELATQRGATLFMVLLAAFAARLGRLAGQEDVVVGTPVAGRAHPDLERMIGFIVNTLALRTRVGDDPSFEELLTRTRQATVDGLAHAELPFEQLVERLRPRRSMAHAPVFQAQLILQNTPPLRMSFADLEATPIVVDPKVAKFDLTLAAERRGDCLDFGIEYSTDLFDPETIADFADRFAALLTAIAENPGRRVSELDALTGVLRWEVLEGLNASELPLPTATTVLDLISGGLGNIAVSGPDGTALTYRELDERSGRIAALLRAHGAGPEAPVGLCLPRTPDLVAAILGVWRAGAAYLPLDPNWPTARLAGMLADSGARILLGAGNDLGFAGTVLTPEDAAGHEPAPAVPVHGEDLAYLIYTSGSTGRPKGVEVPHRAVLNLLVSFQHLFDLDPADRFAAVTTLSFDISVLELLLPLVAGSEVLVVPTETVADGPALRDLLADAGVTAMQATPATWRLLETAGGVPAGVVTRVCGGEALTRDLADALLSDEALVWNAYGPTETTVWSSAALVDAAPAPVVLGAPIGNTSLYVLDARMEPVPPGVVGELHIGGEGVARGYRGMPGRTADRFRPNPFGPGRLYATGDQVRLRRDGMLEFLGRADHQVKVRGFRIELGEVEAALLRCAEVAEAVVVTRGAGEDVRIVAYLVPDGDAGRDPDLWSRLRARLAQRLPEYMVPATAVLLETMPLTANGKVDRQALPDPVWAGAAERVAPRDPVERVLAGIWQEVLGLPDLGVHDDFFVLGGHSLLAAKVVARVRAAFSVTIPIGRMFAAPTVAGLARVLTELEDRPGQIAAIAQLRVELDGRSTEDLRAMLGETR
ncbi:non-ribosomal peptide synthetase [Amycolatopsis aidingensis]|uniref:non-ribosomal peptide synthetase n=1 Tax=Amycolatopsis aidingensis TaxID=2842453 RepID=UPI001C0DDAED|nr:non-ribosomal peptide synthetase [Amycolatopsis aidingensis]